MHALVAVGLLAAIVTDAVAQGGALLGGRLMDRPVSDTLLVGRWSAAFAGGEWRLDIGPNRRYRMWQRGGTGDTLIASMGEWALRPVGLESGPPVQYFCVRPIRREWVCGRIIVDDLGHPHGWRWQFVEAERNAMSWVAYRFGRAPWELDGDPGAAALVVYALNEISDRPHLRGCPVVPRLPAERAGPVRVLAQLVVEPDSTPSHIEILDAPDERLRARALATVRSCRFTPGRLDGIAVRVRVQLPVDFH